MLQFSLTLTFTLFGETSFVLGSFETPLSGELFRLSSIRFSGDYVLIVAAVPLAAGENHFTRFEFTRIIEEGTLGFVQPDLSKSGGITEVILATGTSVEGEATAAYLAGILKGFPIRITRIASGVPMGGDLKYIDQVTLKRAMEGRHAV